MKKTLMNRVVAIGAATGALLASMAISAPTASASAQGCTGSNLYADPVLLCTYVKGESTKVHNIEASIDIQNYTCNGEFKVWGTYKNGKRYSDKGKAKCGLGRVWVNFNPKHEQFKSGTKVCSALIERGKVRDEHACIEIQK